MSDFKLECEQQYDNNLFEYRAIQRFVWYQIRKMVKSDLNLGRIIRVDENGILRVNAKSKLITDEQKRKIHRLISNERDGIYRIHRFKDLDKKIENKEEYIKWFDGAMNSFMQTVPTKRVFYTEPIDLYFDIIDSHSYDELNRQDFSGYSLWQVIYALDAINPFLVGMLLGDNIEVEEINYRTYIKFKYGEKYLYAKKGYIELYDENLKKLDDTIHTLLFKHYQEPIHKVLNSIMLPVGGIHVLPNEGLDDPSVAEIENETTKIVESENYKQLAKKYNLYHSRVK